MNFVFFGEVYDEMLIGSNGVVTFDLVTNDPSGFCAWSFNESIPDSALFLTTIFGPYMDIDPSVGGSGQINWTVFGDAPCRTMVVNFPDIPYFSCNNLSMTTQIVIYETTNVVEVYLENRSDQCPGWNSGNAALGIQNQDGTVGFVAPGRNTGNWAAFEEAWRFTPNGTSNVEFAWLNADDEIIGTDPTINVCPDDDVTTYTARAIYTNCNGDVITETDDVTVTLVNSFSVDLGGDQQLCDQSSYVITAEIIDGDPAAATFLWSTGETTQSITVNTSGDYSVEVSIGSCTINESVNIQFGDTPIIELGPNIDTCFETQVVLDASPSNMNPNDASYIWSLDGVIIVGETSPTLTVTEYGLYSVSVSFGTCTSEDDVMVSPSSNLGVDLGEDFETCFDEVVILDGSPSTIDPALASYEWRLDGVLIPGATEPLLTVTIGGTYSVLVTFGDCSDQDSVSITGRDDLEVALGEDFRTCPNEPHTISAATSETDVTYQWFLNESLLVGETGSSIDINIEGDTMGIQTYTVEISKGDCTGSDSLDITLYDIGNCIISQGISPNGSPGYNDILDLKFLNDRTGISRLQIFNRYGLMVYERNGYVNEWRGQSDDGNDLPTGTYFYVLDLLGVDPVYGSQATGWIYLNQDAN